MIQYDHRENFYPGLVKKTGDSINSKSGVVVTTHKILIIFSIFGQVATGYWLLVTGCWLLVAGCLLLVVLKNTTSNK